MLEGLSAKKSESFIAKISILGTEIPFKIWTRPLKLGHFGTIQYYWMNVYPKRKNKYLKEVCYDSPKKINVIESNYSRNSVHEDSHSNFSSIVRYWSALSYEKKIHYNHLSINPFLFSICYLVVCDDKSLQNVYNDAHLLPKTVKKSSKNLNDDVMARVNNALKTKDFFEIQKELDFTLCRNSPTDQLIDEHQKIFGDLMDHGKKLFKTKGTEGILEFAGYIKNYISGIRKRSGNESGRAFINFLSYHCKYGYYTCCANAWNALIPWIKENRGLDSASEGFLRLWHNQNPTIFIPKGKTVADVQSAPFDFLKNDPFYEEATRRAFAGQRNRENYPEEIRDVFNGQILALHPLSGFFMNDYGLRNSAGQFFFSQDYQDSLKNGLSLNCNSYSNLVKAILYASNMYKSEREKQNSIRKKIVKSPSAEGGTIDFALKKVVSQKKYICVNCNTVLRYKSWEKIKSDKKNINVELFCKKCDKKTTKKIHKKDIEV